MKFIWIFHCFDAANLKSLLERKARGERVQGREDDEPTLFFRNFSLRGFSRFSESGNSGAGSWEIVPTAIVMSVASFAWTIEALCSGAKLS